MEFISSCIWFLKGERGLNVNGEMCQVHTSSAPSQNSGAGPSLNDVCFTPLFFFLFCFLYATHRNVKAPPSVFWVNLPRQRQIEGAGVQWRTFKGLFVHSWKVPAERRKLFWLCWGRRWRQACSYPGMMGKDSLKHGMRATEFWPADAIMPGGQSCRRGNNAVFWEWSLKLQVALFSTFFFLQKLYYCDGYNQC